VRNALGIAVLALGIVGVPASARAGDGDAGVGDAGVAKSGDIEARFHRATDDMVRGHHARAARELVAIADEAPKHHFADDALFSAAQLYEERLGDPARAADLYRRLLDHYPDSRTALAASRRLESLRKALGPNRKGAGALAAFNEILQRYPERPEAESIELMEKLVAGHADWVGLPQALLWLGSVHERAGRYDRAIARYLEVTRRWPDTEDARDAFRGAGDSALAAGDYGAAERYYRAMRDPESPARVRTFRDAMRRVRTARLRARLYTAAQVVVVVALLLLLAGLRLGAGSWRDMAAAMVPPPTEIIYMLPIAVLLSAASFTAHYAIAPAVIIVCSGGLIVTWLSGASLRAGGRPGAARALAHAAISFLAILAITYIALHRQHLLDMLIRTVRFGPDV
jgi:TolA-binding protein